MERIYGKPLITEEETQRRIRELGRMIAEDYQGKDLLLVGILKGAFIFFSDLVRGVPLPLKLDFMIVSSYGKRNRSSGKVKILSDLTMDIEGLDVLLVEDIVDSGLTINYLKNTLLQRNPASLKTCVLLDKAERRKVNVELDYIGFNIPNKYVIGYGLDYQNKYRNLPYIAILDVTEE